MTARYGQLANLTLKLTDLLLMLAALGLGIVVTYAPSAPLPVSGYAVDFLSTRITVANALLGGLLLLVWYVDFNLQGLYRSHRLSSLREELIEVGRAVFFASAGLLIVGAIGKWRTINLETAACISMIALLLIGGTRVLVRLNLSRLRLHGHNHKRILIVGTRPRAE